MNSLEFNEALKKLQNEWTETILLPYAENNFETISKPFFYGVSEEYCNANKRIMIVGQETKDFGAYTDDWLLNDIQPWCINYLRFQLWKIPTNSKIKYNASPFWKMFREFNNKGITPSWNNVDKVQQYNDESKKNFSLSFEQEKYFSCKYGNDNKSLLQREIELDEPDILLFITGPNYSFTMATALGLNEKILKSNRPTKQNYCVEITNLLNINSRVFWTYHPAYLNRNRNLITCVNYICEKLL